MNTKKQFSRDENMRNHINDIFKQLGGRKKAAELLKVKYNALVMWAHRGLVPYKHMPKILKLLKVKAEQLRPGGE